MKQKKNETRDDRDLQSILEGIASQIKRISGDEWIFDGEEDEIFDSIPPGNWQVFVVQMANEVRRYDPARIFGLTVVCNHIALIMNKKFEINTTFKINKNGKVKFTFHNQLRPKTREQFYREWNARKQTARQVKQQMQQSPKQQKKQQQQAKLRVNRPTPEQKAIWAKSSIDYFNSLVNAMSCRKFTEQHANLLVYYIAKSATPFQILKHIDKKGNAELIVKSGTHEYIKDYADWDSLETELCYALYRVVRFVFNYDVPIRDKDLLTLWDWAWENRNIPTSSDSRNPILEGYDVCFSIIGRSKIQSSIRKRILTQIYNLYRNHGGYIYTGIIPDILTSTAFTEPELTELFNWYLRITQQSYHFGIHFSYLSNPKLPNTIRDQYVKILFDRLEANCNDDEATQIAENLLKNPRLPKKILVQLTEAKSLIISSKAEAVLLLRKKGLR